MFRPLFLMCLIGCEQIEPTGDPLRPVDVSQATQSVDGDATEVEVDDMEEEEAFTISSEELAAIADGSSVEAPPVPVQGAQAERSEPAPTQAQLPTAPQATAVAPPPPPGAMPPTGWSQALGKAWPVRLVTTIPNASPPRAILGLPDGKEVVVNPGSMVPDLGLVVVAISPGSAELAKIAPAGDHATIESITLRAQY